MIAAAEEPLCFVPGQTGPGISKKTFDARSVFFLGLLLAGSGLVSPPVALVGGVAFGFTVAHPYRKESSSLARLLLQISVVFLGFGMNLKQVIHAGESGFLYTAFSICFAVVFGLLLGKVLNVGGRASYLITFGTAICGGSAIAALAPIADANEEEVSVSMGTVFLLNSLALLLFPVIGWWLHLSQTQFGLWAALAIHDTSSVVGAAERYGTQALAIGTTVKLARALWIVPVSLVTAAWIGRRHTARKTRVNIPWFIFLFIGASVLSTYVPRFTGAWLDLNRLGKSGLTATLFLIGTSLSKRDSAECWHQAPAPGHDPLDPGRISLADRHLYRSHFLNLNRRYDLRMLWRSRAMSTVPIDKLFTMRVDHFSVLLALAVTPALFAQTQTVMTPEDLFRRNIGSKEQMDKQFPPFKIAGNLYYVGTESLASFLIVTPEGDILINSDYERNVPTIKDSVEKLGFHFNDIKILLGSHAHADHMEGDAMVKELTGAKLMVMQEDIPALLKITPEGKPQVVDRILHDGDEVSLGGTTLVAHLTPGHTRGCTSWSMKIQDGGKSYNVVIIGSIGVNPGYQLVNNKDVPHIADEYMHSFAVLRSLPCDIPLGSHPGMFNMAEKYAKLGKSASNPFIDPEGYRKEIDVNETAFTNRRAEQMKAAEAK